MRRLRRLNLENAHNMRIGQYQLDNNLILAPMAGVTDRPFRELCRTQGAGLAVSEMLSSNPRVWNSTKSKLRMDYHDESGLRSVQIAGADPLAMAHAAQLTVQQGAQIVDINMGCPSPNNSTLSRLVRCTRFTRQSGHRLWLWIRNLSDCCT